MVASDPACLFSGCLPALSERQNAPIPARLLVTNPALADIRHSKLREISVRYLATSNVRRRAAEKGFIWAAVSEA